MRKGIPSKRIIRIFGQAIFIRRGGYCLEFGVYKGETKKILSKFVNKVYGFDSFEGVQKDWRWDIDMKFFDLSGKLPKLPNNIELIVGYFEDTLPKFVENMNGNVTFLHIDSGIYDSANFVLKTLEKKIVPKTVIVFDEYWNYPNWEQHEHRAFSEFIDRTGYKLSPLHLNIYP